jgi:hypothetical protein
MLDFCTVTTTDWLKISGAIAVFSIGLWQYWKAQKWKRREFIAAQMKDFEADKKIQLTMTMLDWNDRELYFPSEVGDKPIVIKVDETILCSALLPHEYAGGYSKDEARIRDCFDHFLDMLVRLWNFIEAGLISVEEVRPYMDYWIELVAGKKSDWHTPQFVALLLNHIHKYDFERAANLIRSFGFNDQPSKEELDEAIRLAVENREKSLWRASSDQVNPSPIG